MESTFILLLLSWLCTIHAQDSTVRVYFVDDPWRRWKRGVLDGSGEIEAIVEGVGSADSVLKLKLVPRRHPVTSSTIIEWFTEDGEHIISRGSPMDDCWFSGRVEGQAGSVVAIGVCHGWSGIISLDNETLLLEPVFEDGDDPISHRLYPVDRIRLDGDMKVMDGQGSASATTRIKRRQIDYDDYGNEVLDTIPLEQVVDYIDDPDDYDDHEDATVSSTLTEVDDYDLYPAATESSMTEGHNDSSRLNNSASNDPERGPDVDGFSVDKLWEVDDDKLPLEAKRRKPVSSKAPANKMDPAKWLEMALAIDHTVIKFHGRQRVHQYVLTLLNIVSAIYEDTSLEANLRLVVSRLVFYEDRKQGQVREGNSKRSLENVNAWNAGLLRNSASEWPHDVAVWLTRYELGGPSGYAPVSGVCDPDRSCSLNRDEGLTSAFIIAHEVGHV